MLQDNFDIKFHFFLFSHFINFFSFLIWYFSFFSHFQCGIAASYVLLNQKVCQMPLMSSHDDVAAQLPLKHSGDSNSISEAVKKFAQSYYEWSQIYHYVIFGFCIVILILSFINIVPKHQDLKVITISLVSFICYYQYFLSFASFKYPKLSLLRVEIWQS